MKIIKGDLIQLAKQRPSQFDLIAHSCNCQNNFGAGIALQIKREFPEAYEADCATIKGDSGKLGTYTFAVIGGLTLLNIYGQDRFGRGKHADYGAIRSCLKKIKEDFGDKRIGLPKIGAGLAGGDWEIISKIIEEELEGVDVTIVEYQP